MNGEVTLVDDCWRPWPQLRSRRQSVDQRLPVSNEEEAALIFRLPIMVFLVTIFTLLPQTWVTPRNNMDPGVFEMVQKKENRQLEHCYAEG